MKEAGLCGLPSMAAGTGKVKDAGLCGLSSKTAGSEDDGVEAKGLVAAGTITVAGAAAKGAGRVAKAAGAPGKRLDAAPSACFGGFAGNACLALLLVPKSAVTALADCCGAASVGAATGNCAWFICFELFNMEAGAPVTDRAYPSLAGPAFKGTEFPASAARTAFCDPGIIDPAVLKEGANKEGPDPLCAGCIARLAMAAPDASGAPPAVSGSALSPFRSPSA